MTNGSNNDYITIGAITGGLLGARHGYFKPSEKSCIKISSTPPSKLDAFSEYRDSFNMKAANTALADGNINLSQYNIVENLVKSLDDVLKTEQHVDDIMNTPFEKRQETYKSAVKKANKANFACFKNMFKLRKDRKLIPLLIENGILDSERFCNISKAIAKKSKMAYKELAKRAFKGLAIGASIGAAIGYLIDRYKQSN